MVFILYFCRRFGRPTRVPRGKPVRVRRSPAAVSPTVDAQYDRPLYTAIDVWEGRADTDKPEDLPNLKKSVSLSRKKHSGDRRFGRSFVPVMHIPFLPADIGL